MDGFPGRQPGVDTETWRPELADLDERPVAEQVALFVDDELQALRLLRGHPGPVVRAVEQVAERFSAGGRLVYAGAGTSGRLALLDAVECQPTFGLGPERVTALLAGGTDAFAGAVEDAEDDEEAGRRDVDALRLGADDSLVAVSASGRTPYTVAAARTARRTGALTVGVACNNGTPLGRAVDVAVEVPVGPAMLAGSTRLTAGTVQKVVLNAISTLVMVRSGRTYGNLMVDLSVTNTKLRDRARGLVATISGVDLESAERLLDDTGGDVKTAVLCAVTGLPADGARELLT